MEILLPSPSDGKATSIVTSGSETLASIATALAAAINANSAVNTNYHAVASTDTVNITCLDLWSIL